MIPDKKKVAGRPAEERIRLVAHVKQETADAINAKVDKSDKNKNTIGKVIDNLAKPQTNQ